MSSGLKRARQILQNPYAHIEHLEDVQEAQRVAESDATGASIELRLSRSEISKAVRSLHRRLWRERVTLLGREVEDPIELLDPEMALRLLGYDFEVVDGLGDIPSRDGRRREAGGMIDRDNKVVRVASRFTPRMQRFTAAHELGHAVLHPFGGGIHRDLPTEGSVNQRDRGEVEANRFASEFLMPANLLHARFVRMFTIAPFRIDQQTSLALGLGSETAARARLSSARALALLLATAEHFDGRHFRSLAEQFHVSATSMAIRLEELDLIEW